MDLGFLDSGFVAGAGLLVAKLSAFGLLVYASRSATRAVREDEARKRSDACRATAATAEIAGSAEHPMKAAWAEPALPSDQGAETRRPAREPETV